MKSEGFIFINEDGKFLTLSERTTHTGHHIDIDFTQDLNRAYVARQLDRKTLNQHPQLEQLHKLPAEVETIRVVKIKV